MDFYRQPQNWIVYISMGAKNTAQPPMPIQPDFAKVAKTLLEGQVQKEPDFAIDFILKRTYYRNDPRDQLFRNQNKL